MKLYRIVSREKKTNKKKKKIQRGGSHIHAPPREKIDDPSNFQP